MDPFDEAMTTQFACSVNNEAVLRALFKVKETELSFKRAIKIATETEDAAKIANKTVYEEQQKVNKEIMDQLTVDLPGVAVYLDDILMPAPTNVNSLRSFLGSVQFYCEFLPNLSMITEPLQQLTKKNVQWKWSAEQETSFLQQKQLLTADTVLTCFNSKLPIV
ncbi:uncharacterized protein [Watersipora subatra]|uniref:uncharacterized protein n=1 Tax=Watersipora subatra TaxID=2589382 RepID=UPI00355B6BA4